MKCFNITDGEQILEYLEFVLYYPNILKTTDHMFCRASSITSIKFSDTFDTSQVTSMKAMFHTVDKITILNLSTFDTSQVTNMHEMFAYDTFKILDISNFSNNKNIDTTNIFKNTKQIEICYVDNSRFFLPDILNVCFQNYIIQEDGGHIIKNDSNKINLGTCDFFILTFYVI